MADLRIVDAPEIPTENITGEEKLPTGGSGNYSITLDSVADYTKTKKDLADNTSVDGKVSGVRQELETHIEDLLNPHQVTKGQIGLGNVDNTADADKPVSNSTQASIISAVAPKADKTYVDNQLTLKANKVDVYTKLETYTKQESSDLVNNSISTALTPVNSSLDLAKRGIANRYDSSLTYNSGERVVLNNGDIVKSTINGNTNNPNTDMAGWVKTNSASQIIDESGKTQQQINNSVIRLSVSVAEMISINNPKNGQFVRTLSYHEGLSKGGNMYRYESARQLENDGGSVINGWVVQDKTSLTVWDFGYKIDSVAESRTALTKAIQSDFPLQFLEEEISAHIDASGVGAGTIERVGSKIVFGSNSKCIAKNTRIRLRGGSFVCTNFTLSNLGLNVGLTFSYYDHIFVDQYNCLGGCYDGVLVWRANDPVKSKAVVQNSFVERAGRIGFTADIDAANVLFKKCHTDYSYQGFHAEKCVTLIEYDNCTASRCGQSLPDVPHASDQPLNYAGGFMASGLPHVRYKNCKNIQKSQGVNRDYIINGIGKFEEIRCDGFNWYIEENSGEILSNIRIEGSSNGSINNQSTAHVMSGSLILKDLSNYGSIGLLSKSLADGTHGFSSAHIENVNCGRIQFQGDKNAFLYVDNLKSTGTYWNEISRFKNIHIGYLEYNFTATDTSQFPNYGYRFFSQNLQTFHLDQFHSSGSGGGYQINLNNVDNAVFKGGYIGKITSVSNIQPFSGVDFNSLNITAISNMQVKTSSTTTAELSSSTASINTKGKYLGRDVYNTTISKFMSATGSTSTSTWVSYDGATTITPV